MGQFSKLGQQGFQGEFQESILDHSFDKFSKKKARKLKDALKLAEASASKSDSDKQVVAKEQQKQKKN